MEDSALELPEQSTEQQKLHCATLKSNSSAELESNFIDNKKQYNVNRAVDRALMITNDLPDIERSSTMQELPGSTTKDAYLIQDPVSNQVTMLDNLPLLECHDDLEDFETLMNIAYDYNNEELLMGRFNVI